LEVPGAPKCTTTFDGNEDSDWATAANWTGGVPSGRSAYGCIPAGYPTTVTFNGNSATSAEIGGLFADNSEGITLQGGALTLAAQRSMINNVKPGGAAVTLAEGVTLALTGTEGALGGNVWNGPGSLEIPEHAEVKMGDCATWGYRGHVCASTGGGTPTPGYGGLQVRNLGHMWGSGISLCRNGAAHAAKLENLGVIQIKESGGFGGAPECGEVGPVLNGQSGRIALAQLDGNGCNVVVRMGSLANEGLVSLSSCLYLETADRRRPTLEVGGSWADETGVIRDWGIIEIGGDFSQTAGSELDIGIKATEFGRQGTLTTNFGTIRVSGNARIAGVLNIEPDNLFTPALGQRLQIVHAGEAEGSLSGEFTLGNHCIPTEPGNGYQADYQPGLKGSVTLEVVKMADC
jgi:hypothetical protein